MAEFVPQLTIPDRDDPYFLQDDYGGYSPCIPGHPSYFTGSVLANCVGYAWGIAAKRENNPQCNIGWAPGTTWPTNAWYWIDYANGRATGLTPQLGAIACWRNASWTNGHVASVEQIFDDGSWLASESGYNGYYFRTHVYNSASDKEGFIFRGFIYLNGVEPGPTPPPTPGDKVQYPIAIGNKWGLQVGDKVKIIGTGRAAADGSGGTAYGLGWVRYVQGIYERGDYPFRVGFRHSNATTGFYKGDALLKLK